MSEEIKVPPVGESITEGVIAEWKVADGDIVEEEQELFELETDKITMAVESPAAGKVKIDVKAGETVEIDQVVGSIDTDAAEQAELEESDDTDKDELEVPQTEGKDIHAPAGMPQAKAKLDDQEDTSELPPSVRRLVSEHNLKPSEIKGTGKDGRLTKGDVLNYIESARSKSQEAPEQQKEKPKLEPPEKERQKTPPQPREERQTRKPMSMLRARIAERMVMAQQNAAMLTTFNEVDMTNLMAMRKRYKEAFVEKHGIKLGIMSFFIKASVEGLKAVPAVNAFIDGNDIVTNHFYDIGVAVSTERGLVVPVIRDVDKLSFADLERELASYAEKARNKSLTLDDLTGGVFTVSNGGVFGSMLSTPILNPPQSAILGMHGTKKRPVVVGDDDRIEVRPMMYLAVSYDHRLVDGKEAVTFLRRIVECIEDPERMMFEV